MHGLLPGSTSKYCLQHSPIPVIVVRPSPKREKKKKKRLADPTRRSYNNILQMSERRGGRIFDASSSTDSSISRLPDEEAAVAEALGLPPSYTTSRSSLSVETGSERSSVSHDDHEPTSSAMWNSLDAVVRNRAPGDSDSPEITDNDGVDDNTITQTPSPQDAPDVKLSTVNSNESSQGSTSTLRPDTSGVQSTQPEDRPEESWPAREDARRSRVNIPVIVTEDTSNEERETTNE